MAPRRKDTGTSGNDDLQPAQGQDNQLPGLEQQSNEPDKEPEHVPDVHAQDQNVLLEEMNARKVDEMSQAVSKAVAEAVAVCLKEFMGKNKSMQNMEGKEMNQASNHLRDIEQGSGSSRAGEVHRSMPTPPTQEDRYTPPHKREEAIGQRNLMIPKGNGNGNPRPHLHQLYNVTNPNNQPGLYEEGTGFGLPVMNNGVNAGNGAYYQARGAQYYHHPLPNRNAGMIDPEIVRETVQELYGPALRQIGRPEFNKPYPDMVDLNNPYPRGYKIPNFSLFSGEDEQSTVEHVARFTIKCGELANLENFSFLKLRLFPNTLTGIAFAWYTTLPRNFIFTWQEMERQFHIQFYKTEPEVCIADLSRATQKKGETVDLFIARFKKMKNRCKVFLPEVEFVKMAQKGLDFELRKKFQGMEFRDFFELAAKVTEYEELLKEETYKNKTTVGTYYQEVEDVVLAEIRANGSCVCPLLKKKQADSGKKNSTQPAKDVQYTFDVSKTEDIFDFLAKEKFISFPPDHRLPTKEELKGRDYCKYHNSYNHNTNLCWAFKNVLQERINKGVLKFPEKQEAMAIDEDPFPPVASINVNDTDLRNLLNEKQGKRVRRCWIPKGQMFQASEKFHDGKERYFQTSRTRNDRESMAFRPRIRHFFDRPTQDSHYFRGESLQYGSKQNQSFNHDPIRRKIVPGIGTNRRYESGPRYVRPTRKEITEEWKVATHKKFPRPLTRTQKRRLLRERAAARREEFDQKKSKSKFGRSATEDKDEEDDSCSDTEVKGNKTIDFRVGDFHISVDCATGVIILPKEFKLASDNSESNNKENKPAVQVDEVNEAHEVSSGVIIKEEDPSKPKKVIIEKPTPQMTKHIRPLYIKAHVNGKPVARVLIDNGSAVNVLPVRMLGNLGKSEEDLIPTEVSVAAFTGETTKTIGVFPADVTVGSLSSMCAFFVVNSSANFQALLGRDWIHANQCIPSSMHQLLLFWKGDEVEIVEADSQPFQATSSLVEARYYNGDFGPIKVRGKGKRHDAKAVYMETPTPSQVLDKILKPTVIVPFRPMIQPLIEDIDD